MTIIDQLERLNSSEVSNYAEKHFKVLLVDKISDCEYDGPFFRSGFFFVQGSVPTFFHCLSFIEKHSLDLFQPFQWTLRLLIPRQ